MVFFSRGETKVDVEKYEARLNKRGYVCMNIAELKNRLVPVKNQLETLERFLLDYMSDRGVRLYTKLTPGEVYDYLIEGENISKSKFATNVTKKGYSVDKRKVLMPLQEEGYAPFFFSQYFKWVNMQSTYSLARNIVSGWENQTTIKGYDSELVPVKFSVNPQVNLRFNYEKEAIVNLGKQFTDVIQAPEGYVFISGDLAQGDARTGYNLYLKTPYTEKIMEQHLDDIYEGFYHLVELHEEAYNNSIVDYYEPLVQEAFKKGENPDSKLIRSVKNSLKGIKDYKFPNRQVRDKYKVDGLQALFYNRHTRNPESSKFIQKLGTVFESIPEYKSFVKQSELWTHYAPYTIVESYFGFKQEIVFHDSYNKRQRPIYKIFNYPNQTGTAEEVILISNGIVDASYEVTQDEDAVTIEFVRHDEPIFRVKEKDLEKVAWIFENYREFQIDDWFPTKIDKWTVGYAYGKSDEELERRFEAAWKKDIDKVTHYEKGPKKEYQTLPSSKYFSYFFHQVKSVEDGVSVYATLVDNETNDYFSASIASEDSAVGVNEAAMRVLKSLVKPYLDGKHLLLAVNSTQLSQDVRFVESPVSPGEMIIFSVKLQGKDRDLVRNAEAINCFLLQQKYGGNYAASLNTQQREFLRQVGLV